MRRHHFVAERLRVVGAALEPATDWDALTGNELRASLETALGEPSDEVSYLVLAVLFATTPRPESIRNFSRRWRLDSLSTVLDRAIGTARRTQQLTQRLRIEVCSGVIVDVNDTANSKFTTGIQRVARESVRRWMRDHELTLAVWGTGFRRMRPPSNNELRRLFDDPSMTGPSLHGAERRVIVPFRATFVLPEIAVDDLRAARVRTIARYACRRSLAIGFDCIPVTTAETAGPGMPGAFSRYLTTLARFDAIAAISTAAEGEFAGWQRMLAGTGIIGPAISEVSLPFDGERASDEQIARTSEQLGLDGKRVLLCVGSHEPRKNHLTLLAAAESLWREGIEFTLVLVGGNSWNAQAFNELVDQLQRRGRQIVLLSGVDDATIWSLYAIARASVFPSLNEGFGLPVVESLANRTPVVTSDFGSMRELGAGNGALLVDPRDARAIAIAVRTLLEDDLTHARLVAESDNVVRTTWDDYAQRIWDLASPKNSILKG